MPATAFGRSRTAAIAAVVASAVCASPAWAESGTFEVGAFWQPPAKPVDYNTVAVWDAVVDAKVDLVFGHRIHGPRGITLNKTDNESAIAQSTRTGVRLLCTDSAFQAVDPFAPTPAALIKAIEPYRNDNRVSGLMLRDEPWPFELEGLANTYRRAKAIAPRLAFNVNLLGISVESALHTPVGRLLLSNPRATGAAIGVGGAPSGKGRVGQTVVLPKDMTFLEGLELQVDPRSFSVGEALVMRLYTNSDKTQVLAETRVTGYPPPSGGWDAWKQFVYFGLRVQVVPEGKYYFELTHEGGDGQVKLEAGSTDSYADGALFLDGEAQARDLWFRLYGKPRNYGTPYENYVDTWLDLSGADEVEYDYYPFQGGGGDAPQYFQNAEVVRERAMAVGARYGAYLQATEMRDMHGNVALRAPNLHEARYLAYGLVAYGFRRLTWFTYWLPDSAGNEVFLNAPVSATGVPGPQYQILRTINTELRNLGGVLRDLVSVDVFHTGGTVPLGTKRPYPGYFLRPLDPSAPLVLGRLRDAAGRVHVVVGLRDYKQGARVPVVFWPRPAALYEVSKDDGQPVRVKDYSPETGVATLDFQPGEGRLLVLPKGYLAEENLARAARVTASSSVESTAENVGTRCLVDGDTRPGACTFTSEDDGPGDWVQLDLGAQRPVRQIDLFSAKATGKGEGDKPRGFRVAVSKDGLAFTAATVLPEVSAVTSGLRCLVLSKDMQARFVRIEATDDALPGAANAKVRPLRLSEVEVLPRPNYARCAQVTASSSKEGDGFRLHGLLDGIGFSDPTSRGYSSDLTPIRDHAEAVLFDLGRKQQLREVALYPRGEPLAPGEGLPVDVMVSLSDDGKAWRLATLARSLSSPGGEPKSVRFPAQSARFVRIEGSRLRRIESETGRPYRMQLAEVEIR